MLKITENQRKDLLGLMKALGAEWPDSPLKDSWDTLNQMEPSEDGLSEREMIGIKQAIFRRSRPVGADLLPIQRQYPPRDPKRYCCEHAERHAEWYTGVRWKVRW